MTKRQKWISWIVLGIVVQGLVVFGTIYFMESKFAQFLSERQRSSLQETSQGEIADRIAEAAVEGVAVASETAASTQVRKLIGIEHGSATEIAMSIHELFGERIKVSAIESRSSIVVIADQATLDDITELIHELSRRNRELEDVQLSRTMPPETGFPEPVTTKPDPETTISYNPNLELGHPVAVHPEAIPQGNELKYFPIRSGSPESIATAVKEVFGETVKVTPENGSQSVIVVADPQIQVRVSEFITQIEERTQERNAERRKVEELREKERAEARNEFDRRTQPPPVKHLVAENLPHDPFGATTPQEENISSTAKFPADAQDVALDRQAKQLALRIRAAKPDEQANLRKELETITVQQFQHRQQRRQQEFESLSQRLEQLKASHQRRQKHQAEVVERRIQDLLDPNADLRWEEPELSDERPAEVASSSPVGEDDAALTRESVVTRVAPGLGPASSASKSAEPTYNGVTLSEWLRILQTERNQDKVGEAVIAMNHLFDQADPRDLTRITLRSMRIHGTQIIPNGFNSAPESIVMLSILLLTRLPSDIVVDEILSELDQPAVLRPTQDFFVSFLSSIHAKTVRQNFGWKGANGVMYHFDARLLLVHESINRLKTEMRRRSRELISRFVLIALKDDSLTNWSVRCAEKIIRISDQWLSTYPDLIPLVNQLFDKPVTGLTWIQLSSPFYQGPVAAVLLGESGLRIPEILASAADQLKKGYSPIPAGSFQRPTDFDDGLACIRSIASSSPEAVGLLNEILDRDLKAMTSYLEEVDVYNNRPEGSNLIQPEESRMELLVEESAKIIDALAEIGVPAAPSIPQLKVIVDSLKFRELYPQHQPQLQGFNSGGGMLNQMSLAGLANAAIKRINESTPKPRPEPLPDGDFAEPENVSATGISAPNGKPQKSEKTPSTRPVDETTYDGITYTQWLKLLETERKLDKVIAAIDTCTRLAVKGDERRIAKGVFLAESLFESRLVEMNIKTEAWKVGQTGLARLPTETVIEELLRSLKDDTSFQGGRQYQYQFLIEFEQFRNQDREAQIEILRTRSTEIVQELMRLTPAEPNIDSLPTIAAASQVCNLTNRSIKDFDDLTNRMIKILIAGSANEDTQIDLWMIVARTLTQQVPDTPDLAMILVKQAEKRAPASYPVVELLGKLGPLAEPAVPTLVPLFRAELDKFLITLSPRLRPTSPNPSSTEDGRRDFDNSRRMRVQIIRTLGEIGKGQAGYNLVSELKKIVGPELGMNSTAQIHRPGYQDPIKEMTAEAEAACSKFEGMKHSGVQVLSDLWTMNGSWVERSILTPASVADALLDKFRIRGNTLGWNGELRGGSPFGKLLYQIDPSPFSRRLFVIELDEGTASPKKLKLRQVKADASLEDEASNSIAGLYKLSDSTIKLQLSPPGQPAPEAFSSDKDSLPEGQVLIEFQRFIPASSNTNENQK